VAHDFVKRGFNLATTVGKTIEGAKPEFYADDASLRIGIEVFEPRDWQLLDKLNRKALSLLADADVPLDFHASLVLRLEHLFDEQHRLIHAHPELFECGIALVGTAMLAKLDAQLVRLEPPSHTLVVAYSDVNLEFEAAFDRVAASGDRPDRGVSHGYSTGAYDPEAAFRNILRRVRAKAGERQAGPPGSSHVRLRQVPVERDDRTLLRDRTGTETIPVLVAPSGRVLVGEDTISTYLDAHVPVPAGARAHRFWACVSLPGILLYN
jgi:hypothetical protein